VSQRIPGAISIETKETKDSKRLGKEKTMLLPRVLLTSISFITLWVNPATAQTLLAQSRLTSEARTSQSLAETPDLVIEKLFTIAPEKFRSEWFTSNFQGNPVGGGLSRKPTAIVANYVTNIKEQQGAFERVKKKDSNNYIVILKRASVPVQITLNPQGRISKLIFATAPQPKGQ
jgi:hypothetical protein